MISSLLTKLQWVWVFALGLLWSCSEPHAGGNSAETGNPEIAGILYFPDGRIASFTQIQCIPTKFRPRTDSLLSQWTAVTDSAGRFQLDSLQNGICNLEAYDPVSGLRYLKHAIDVQDTSTVTIQDTLRQTGTVRIGTPHLVDGDSGWVIVPGTSISRASVVKFTSIYADSLPSTSIDSILFVPQKGGDPELLLSNIHILPGDTQTVDAPPIHHTTTLTLNTMSSAANLQEDLYAFPLAWRIHAQSLDFTVLYPDTSRISIYRNGIAQGYQISSWNAQTQEAVIWVRLDTLFAQNATQSIQLVYDEASVGIETSLHRAFSSSDSVLAIWQFEDTGAVLMDASESGLHGSIYNTKVDSGVVGSGLWFNGTDSYVQVDGSVTGPLNLGYDEGATFSIWARLDVPNTSRFLFGKGTYQYHLKYQYPSGWLFENYDNETATNYHQYQHMISADSIQGKWFHLAIVTQSGKSAKLYVNGIVVDSTDIYNISGAMRNENSDFQIGRRIMPDNTSGQHFWGIVDEFHVWHQAKSSEWIRMLERNQNPNSLWPVP